MPTPRTARRRRLLAAGAVLASLAATVASPAGATRPRPNLPVPSSVPGQGWDYAHHLPESTPSHLVPNVRIACEALWRWKPTPRPSRITTDLVQASIDQLNIIGFASGLKFTYLGTTDGIPDTDAEAFEVAANTPTTAGWYDDMQGVPYAWSPLLPGYTDSQIQWRTPGYATHGMLKISWNHFNDPAVPVPTATWWANFFAHEWGHQAGLADMYNDGVGFEDESQRMADPALPWGAGDLAGLWAVGTVARSASCVKVLPVLSGGQMYRLYGPLLDRQPDFAGLYYWTNQRRAGDSVARIATRILSSPEAADLAALSNADFLEEIFQRILGRPADPSGRTYWLTKLNNGLPRGEFVASMSESSEHITSSRPAMQTSLVFANALNRMPTPTELQHFVGWYDAGAGSGYVRSELEQTQEYKDIWM